MPNYKSILWFVGLTGVVKLGTIMGAANLNVARPVLLTDSIVIGAPTILGGR